MIVASTNPKYYLKDEADNIQIFFHFLKNEVFSNFFSMTIRTPQINILFVTKYTKKSNPQTICDRFLKIQQSIPALKLFLSAFFVVFRNSFRCCHIIFF
jgi:hypothetical protein